MNQNDKIKRLIKRYKEVLEGGVEDRDPTVCYIYAIKDLESLLDPDGSQDQNICDDCNKEDCTCYDTF